MKISHRTSNHMHTVKHTIKFVAFDDNQVGQFKNSFPVNIQHPNERDRLKQTRHHLGNDKLFFNE
ncbi:CLUMA_CG012746, isoform A [Clunio marinus]|uniref:CLUMA_CG012746, isoform A n=1 Tax=Clunio marinus TaxID=568069 RepID=A0A1J1IGQ7_9DIPT|nr:CLUMA_CG012746, isoform A [Clunio marinus]